MSLDSHYQGFRSRWLDHAGLMSQLNAWALAYPELVHLREIGRTPEGRELVVAIVGPDPERIRPAAWVDANMHASELCGCAVALQILEDAIRLHTEGAPHGMPDHVAARLREVPIHVMPRISPDGAEAVLTTGRYVRSVPRDVRNRQARPHWVAHDLDGDGLALLLRKEDPTGEFVDHPEFPGLLVHREPEDAGPFYKLWTEGSIADWDGETIPDPSFLGDNDLDLNRNFPFSWAPDWEQIGAGPFPGSAPEARAVIDYAHAHPELFFWLNLHTFGGCFIRPMGEMSDVKMNPSELALYKWIGRECERITGYPMVSGFEEFTYEPDRPLRGDLSEWAYKQRGCVAYVCELWDLFTQIGRPRPKRFVDHYSTLGRDGALQIATWDRDHNQGRVVRPWVRVEHPQLGAVEVGGLDIRFGVTNPPLERLDEICRKQSEAFYRVACLAPAIRVDARSEPLGEGKRLVTVEIRNEGGLATSIVATAASQAWNEGVSLRIDADRVDGAAVRVLGHLDGWMRGLGEGSDAVFYPRSRGSSASRKERIVVRGDAPVTIEVGSVRAGVVRVEV